MENTVDKRVFRIASIPGDGIGTEITDAAIEVLNKLSSVAGTFAFDFETRDWSSKLYKERGYYAPPDGVEKLKNADAMCVDCLSTSSRYIVRSLS